MALEFKRATKAQSRLRMALIGPAGSGKTYSALRVAAGMGGKVALIDTEHGSAAKFADRFEFDTLELTNFHPAKYIEAIKAAESAGYTTLIIDSLTHAWSGTGGILEIVDKAKAASRNADFSAWKDATPIQTQLVEAILQSPCHVIATMRSKMGYEQIPDEARPGRTKIQRVGMQPVQRDGIEYEFDIVGDLADGTLNITKTRWESITGAVIQHPGEEFGAAVMAWCSEGTPWEPPKKVDSAAASSPPRPSRDVQSILNFVAAPRDPAPKPDLIKESVATALGARPSEINKDMLPDYLGAWLEQPDNTVSSFQKKFLASLESLSAHEQSA